MHENVSQIIREELDAIGAQEMLMPVLNPAEIWQRSGRYPIEELFKLEDRRSAELVLALSHEEAATTHVAQVVRSYRDLPFSLYHFQVKERDEPRPRAGLLRTREFIMKDAYTFDRDREGLDAHYERYREAYDKIFDRIGLEWYRVESDVGMMGGVGAHEYMAPQPGGGERRRARARLRRQRRGRQRRCQARDPARGPARAADRRHAGPDDRRRGRPGAARRGRARCSRPTR